MAPNYPVVNAGLKYANGLGLSKSADKIVTIAAGAARDSLNINDIALSADVAVNGSVVGANGVDQAVLVANQQYAVYVIASSNSVFTSTDALGGGPSPTPTDPPSYILSGIPAPLNPIPPAGLLSLSSNVVPFLPTGYDMYRRVGWVRTDGSANILQFWQYGDGEVRTYYYDAGVKVLNAGGSATYVNVPLAVGVDTDVGVPAVPPYAAEVLFSAVSSAAASVALNPFGSSAANGVVNYACGSTITLPVKVPSKLNAGVPTIAYKTSAPSLTLYVTGIVDYLF